MEIAKAAAEAFTSSHTAVPRAGVVPPRVYHTPWSDDGSDLETGAAQSNVSAPPGVKAPPAQSGSLTTPNPCRFKSPPEGIGNYDPWAYSEPPSSSVPRTKAFGPTPATFSSDNYDPWAYSEPPSSSDGPPGLVSSSSDGGPAARKKDPWGPSLYKGPEPGTMPERGPAGPPPKSRGQYLGSPIPVARLFTQFCSNCHHVFQTSTFKELPHTDCPNCKSKGTLRADGPAGPITPSNPVTPPTGTTLAMGSHQKTSWLKVRCRSCKATGKIKVGSSDETKNCPWCADGDSIDLIDPFSPEPDISPQPMSADIAIPFSKQGTPERIAKMQENIGKRASCQR